MAQTKQPVPVGTAKQLFIDHRFIASSKDVTLKMHPPTKAGAVLVGEHPWEAGWVCSGTVLDDDGAFKMYYRVHEAGRKGKLGRQSLCYAVSRDGVHWEKPKLGLVKRVGSTDNNILRLVGGTPFIDPTAPASQRFKHLTELYWPDPERAGLYIYYSADGLKWKLHPTRLFPFVPDTQNQVFYDTRIKKYVAYVRTWNPMRKVGRCEMADVMGPWPFKPAKKPYYIWGKDKVPVPSTEVHTALSYDAQDPPDSDHYTPAVVQYPWAQDAYFSFPSAYLHFPDPPAGKYGNDGLLDIQLAISRDGKDFVRPDRSPYIPLGVEGSRESKCLYMFIGMLRVQDEIYQYYVGFHHSHGEYVDWPELRDMGAVFRVVQRLDGFVSARAAYEGGWLKTPLITFQGQRLELNINTSALGQARVEIRDTRGKPIPGYTLPECDPIHGNYLRKTVTWGGSSDVAALADRPVRLHFVMRSADLYAFQFATSAGSH